MGISQASNLGNHIMSKQDPIRQLQAAGEKINSAAMLLNQAGFFGLAEHVSILADELYSEARLIPRPLKMAKPVPPMPARPAMVKRTHGKNIGVWKGGC